MKLTSTATYKFYLLTEIEMISNNNTKTIHRYTHSARTYHTQIEMIKKAKSYPNHSFMKKKKQNSGISTKCLKLVGNTYSEK